jgi:hypothetical protein
LEAHVHFLPPVLGIPVSSTMTAIK